MEIKERIKQKACELYCRYGVKSVTMDEIAGQLGVSKKTIYQSFSDKNELVDEVILDILNHNREACQSCILKADNAIHEVILTMETLQDLLVNLNPSFVIDIQKGHPKTYSKFEEYKSGFLYDSIINNLERGKEEGLYRKEINTDIVAKLRLETLMLPFNSAVFPQSEYSLPAVKRELVDYFLFGMATVKGHEIITKFQKERAKQKEQ